MANPADTANKGMSIGTKVLLSFLGIGLAATIVSAFTAYQFSRKQLENSAISQLKSIRVSKQAHIEDYIKAAQTDLITMSNSLTAKVAAAQLSAARSTLLSDLRQAGFDPNTGSFVAEIQSTIKKYYNDVLINALNQVRPAGSVPPAEKFIHPALETNILQYVYTAVNPAAVGDKNKNNFAADIANYPTGNKDFLKAFAQTDYAKQHEEIHKILDQHRSLNAYYDLFIVDTKGDVVYSSFKELDFNGNLINGPQKDTGLGEAYAGAASAAAGEVFTTDVADYPISYDAPAIFTSAPLFNNDNERLGVVIYQLPLDRITSIMAFEGKAEEAGLGKSGETYIVNLNPANYGVSLSDSRFINALPDNRKKTALKTDAVSKLLTNIGVNKVDTEATKNLKTAAEGQGEYKDYRGVPVLGSYAKMNVPGLNWGIIGEIDSEEAFAPAKALRNRILGLGAALLGLTTALGLLFSRLLTRPIKLLQETITQLASGRDDVRAPVVSGDEVGQVATAFNTMINERNAQRDKIVAENRILQNNIQDLLMTVSDASDGKLDVRAKVTEGSLGNVADALNLMFENVGDLVVQAKKVSDDVSRSAQEISATSALLDTAAETQVKEVSQTSQGVRSLTGQANLVLQNCQEAARASTDAQNSATEGARSVREVVDGMQRIREIVQANAKKIKRLGDRSLEISEIVKFISEISAKTDILALNATIEASRAGENGRGFTVVAEEVRGLADRTRTLTGQIETLVRDIQTETQEAISQMEAQTQEVESGAQRAAGAGQTLQSIVQASERSVQAVNLITQAASTQAVQAKEMLNSIESINQLVADARGQVAQTKKISQSLATLSEQLTRQLGLFQVSN